MWRPSLVLLLAVLPWVSWSAPPDDDDLLAPLTPAHPASKRPRSSHRSEHHPAGSAATSLLTISVTGLAPGVRVFIDGKELGTLPLPAVEIQPGPHTLVLRRLGFLDHVEKITVRRGELHELAPSMQASSAVVAFAGTPASAEVRVDGTLMGHLPLGPLAVPAGLHQIEVRAPGFAAFSAPRFFHLGADESVVVALSPAPPAGPETSAGGAVPEDALPRRPGVTGSTSGATAAASPPGFFNRWYTWVGIGVLAGGALAAGGWAIAHGRSTPPTPTQVCSGNCDAVLNKPAGAF